MTVKLHQAATWGVDCPPTHPGLETMMRTNPRLRRPGFDEEAWRSQAACSEMGTDLFFPVGEFVDGAARQIRHVKTICGRCPVQLHCLAYALATNQEDGVWGGLAPSERRRLRRLQRLRRSRWTWDPPIPSH